MVSKCIGLKLPFCLFESRMINLFKLEGVVGWWNRSVIEMSTCTLEGFEGFKPYFSCDESVLSPVIGGRSTSLIVGM